MLTAFFVVAGDGAARGWLGHREGPERTQREAREDQIGPVFLQVSVVFLLDEMPRHEHNNLRLWFCDPELPRSYV